MSVFLRSSRVLASTTALLCTIGLVLGLLLLSPHTSRHVSKAAAKLQLVMRDAEQPASYIALSGRVWRSTAWGANCSADASTATTGLQLLCQLPDIWKDCSAGIYVDLVSVPWQASGSHTTVCSCPARQPVALPMTMHARAVTACAFETVLAVPLQQLNHHACWCWPSHVCLQGTNVGAQLRKLYNPSQFPGAPVLDLFDATFGQERSRVCALGVEANPAHTLYLTVLNAYFRRKGYPVLVLTETAASVRSGQATFHQDPGLTHELGASLASGTWQRQTQQQDTEVTVPLFDLPAFMSDVVRPMLLQEQWRSGRKPPVGMKMDVEGEEYALLPALITNGVLCDLSMIYLEPHKKNFRTDAGKAVGMLLPAIEKTFEQMRRANHRCAGLNYTHLDDETYLHADTQVPLPPSGP